MSNAEEIRASASHVVKRLQEKEFFQQACEASDNEECSQLQRLIIQLVSTLSEAHLSADNIKKLQDTLEEVLQKLERHDSRILELEGLKDDMKKVIDMAASFSRWREKVYKICAVGFGLMVLKSVGVPEWALKILIAMSGA